MITWQALFFDFDGVLVDSVEVKTRAFARLFEAHGPAVAAQVVDYHRRHSGVTRRDKFRHFYQVFLHQPLGEEELEDLCRRFAALVVDEVVAAPEIPGAQAYLQRWHSRLPCFVVSAAPEDEIHEIVRRRGWSRYFREVLGAPTSKRENLAGLLQKHSLSAAHCRFFGDAESDYRVAQACGVPFMGIVSGPEAPLLQVAAEIEYCQDFTKVL